MNDAWLALTSRYGLAGLPLLTAAQAKRVLANASGLELIDDLISPATCPSKWDELEQFIEKLRTHCDGSLPPRRIVKIVLTELFKAKLWRYSQIEAYPLAFHPAAVWISGCGNCLGFGLLMRWIATKIGITSRGLIADTHYYLQFLFPDKNRFADLMVVADRVNYLLTGFPRRTPYQVLTIQEEFAILFQAQSLVRYTVLQDHEGAMLDARLALELAPTCPIVREHWLQLERLGEQPGTRLALLTE